ncbi:MAG: DUF460 domain-containing protein [Infirmifilum sp.]|uniref:DUF460 domain-containing protein n=1 Tax=Infirmifilum TaxID=2856573 RepID=UPI002357BF5B
MLGIDILPGHSPQAGEPVFAAALVEDGKVVLRLEETSLSEVLKIIEERRVDALATDNVFEIASDFNELTRIFGKYSGSGFRLIEVTRIGDENVKIETICALVGLCKGKPNPIETAEAVALLAYKGIGSEVLLFEEETRIQVGRGRVPGSGGMSRERYRRNIELLIKRKVAEIREHLNRTGIDYDLFIRKSGVGLVGATFIVYAPRDKLNGIVKQESGHDLFVEIQPIKRESISYRPLGKVENRASKKSDRYLIVGVDPGISTGVAVLGLSGEIISVFSRRWLSRSQLLRIILQYGRPVIVATDVNPPPSYVRKIAAQVGATLYVPPRSLSVEEKRRLAEGYMGVENTHQRDALAAAMRALREYRGKFDEVEREAVKYNVPFPMDYAKYLVIRGVPVSNAIQDAIKEYLHLTSKEEKSLNEALEQGPEELLKFYRRLVEKMANENRALQVELRDMREKVNNLEAILKNILETRVELRRQSMDYSKLELKIESLNTELNKIRLQLDESRNEINVLRGVLRDVALGRYIPVLNISLLLENLGHLEKQVQPVIFIDKNYPVSTLKALLDDLAESGRQVIVITRSGKELQTIRKILPIGSRATSLEYIDECIQLEEMLLVRSDSLSRALVMAESDEGSKIRDIFEEYKRERIRSFEGLQR